jgi:hypothetical protein
MACFISSNDNRFYAALEGGLGQVAAVTDQNRFPALRLEAQHRVETPGRRDKTGSRTFPGLPAGFRTRTNYAVTTLLAGWTDQSAEPGYGPLFQAALGAPPLLHAGGTVAGMSSPTQMEFAAPHGLAAGQAVVCNGEIRFVAAVVDPVGVLLNAPFTTLPGQGTPTLPTITYGPATDLPSASIFDFWSPATSVQRVVAGSAVDRMRMSINGDFHTFTFSGPAVDLVDNITFAPGQGALSTFPLEPAALQFNYSLVPGNLGQAWFGVGPTQFFTVTAAEVILNNNVDIRNREFGAAAASCIAAGIREVLVDFSLVAREDADTQALYQAARQRSPIQVMLQMGQQATQMCGIYLKSVVPEVPQFDDDETRLIWRFRGARAQGAIDDEIFVAFG